MKQTKRFFAVLLAVIMLTSAFVFTSSAATLVWPVPGHTTLSQGFHSQHHGIDISDGSIAGATIVAAFSGTVKEKYTCTQQHYGSTGDCGGFGTGLIILGDDNRQYLYGHMEGGSIPSNVYVGARVNAGQTIGRVGTTGNSQGYHLHFGILNASEYINPQNETYTYSTVTSVDFGSSFYAYIIKLDSWKHLENADGNLQLAATNERDPKQIWLFTKEDNGSYKIQSTYDDKVIEAQYAGTTNGTNVRIYEDNWQRWYIKENGSAYYLQPSYCQLVMDVDGNQNTAGTNVQLYTKNDSTAQRFAVYLLTKDGADHAYVKPNKPNASTVSVGTLGLPNQTTVLSWTNSPLKDRFLDARAYTLTVKKDGADYLTESNLETTNMNLTLPAGTYTAQVRAINTKYASYYTDGNTITFTVKDCTHSWNSGVVTTPATCTATGVKTFTCTSCGATRTETIGKTSHTITLINQRDATQDAEGYTGDEYCTVCKQTIKQGTVIQKLDKPADPTPDTPSNPQPENGCKWCGKTHTGFFGGLVGFFHRIFAAIFGARH